MNRLLITAAAVALLSAPAAYAQQQDQHDHHQNNGAQGRQGNGAPGGQSGANGQGGHASNNSPQGGQGGPGGQNGGGPAGGPGRVWNGPGSQAGSHPGVVAVPDRNAGPPRPGFGGPTGQRYQGFQRNFTSPRRYRLPEYRWPRGFGYRRFVFGDFLPSVFIGPDYYLYDYGAYGLPFPPPGAVWVRYGPDALLVDRYSGQIIQVVYGAFYY